MIRQIFPMGTKLLPGGRNVKVPLYSDKRKKNEPKFRLSFVLLFVFASFAVCFALYMREEMPEAPTAPADGTVIISDMAEYEVTSVPGGYAGQDINPVKASLKLDSSYLDSCMFAGDSLTVGLGSYGFIPESRIAAGIGMSVMNICSSPLTQADGSEILAADKINEVAPANLYILLGLNMMESFTDEQLLAAYGDFIDSIDRTATTVYVISVPPVTSERETDSEKPILNSNIDRFNSDLLKFANDRGLYYLDFNSALRNSEGVFDPELAEEDGIHFKKAAYEVFLDYILTHVVQ